MSALRRVPLRQGVPGRLFLLAMPGRDEPLDRVWARLAAANVDLLICLADRAELASRSPEYAAALDSGAAPCRVEPFPVPDFGVPADRDGFAALAARIAQRLATGDTIAIHCGAGIGRTGTLACCALLELGFEREAAEAAVSAAGSGPETAEQRSLVAEAAARRARA